MAAVFEFLINQVLRELSIFLGLIVLLGCIFLKKDAKSILISTLKTIVGVRILQAGTTVLVEATKPMMAMLVERFALQARVADGWIAVGEIFERMDPFFVGNVGLAMMGAWLLHLLFSRFTSIKVIYLTMHVAFIDTILVLWGVTATTSLAGWYAMGLSVLLLAIYWWLGPKIIQPFIKGIVKDEPVTLGHQMMFGGVLAALLAKVGNPKESAEDINLPGWLSIMDDAVIAYAIVMAAIYTLIGAVTGPEVGAQFSQGKHYLLYAFMQGINVAVGILVLVQGVKMFMAELIPAFKGFAGKVVPGAMAAMDIPVLLAYAPRAALLGFICTTAGMVLGVVLQILTSSAYVTVPSVFPMFFGGSVLGVIANAHGGWKGTVFATFLLGVILIFGGAWYAQVVDFQLAAGGHLDYALVWPSIFVIMSILRL